MKLELDDNSGITICICVALLCLTACSLGGCQICQTTDREAIKAGLVQKPIQSGATHWGKP